MTDKNQDPYTLAKGERDGLPYFLGVRQKFHQFEEKRKFPWFLRIEVYYQTTDLGLVPNAEAEVLNKLEDFLMKKIGTATEIYFVGRLTWNGTRTLFCYVSDPEAASSELNKIIEQKLYPREFEYRIEKDPNWKKPSEIVPNIEEL